MGARGSSSMAEVSREACSYEDEDDQGMSEGGPSSAGVFTDDDGSDAEYEHCDYGEFSQSSDEDVDMRYQIGVVTRSRARQAGSPGQAESERTWARGSDRCGETSAEGEESAEAASSRKKTKLKRRVSIEKLRVHLKSRVAWEANTSTNFCKFIGSREVRGHWSPAKRAHLSSQVIPEGAPEVMALGNSRAYIGHFAEDGDVFVAGFQNQTIRLYEVNQGNAPWKLRKEIIARALNWTITDTCLSPNQQLLVYATITPVLHVVNIKATDDVQSVQNITDLHLSFDLGGDASEGSFGIWSTEFSKDGNLLLTGTSDYSTYLYDIEHKRVVYRSQGHRDDVNSICFVDESANVHLSASDDCMIKVWDRRCTSGGGISRAQGVLAGHTEGLTCINSKGDGRYFASNSKDQKLKLWDLRAMTASGHHLSKACVPRFYWDYRWQQYPANPRNISHPNDMSLMTFTGHKVLQTLIRCRWSPLETTGQRYIFTGSQCGGIFVYDVLTGEKKTVFNFHRSVVRDCDWHPRLPMLGSVGWDGCVVRWKNMKDEDVKVRRLSINDVMHMHRPWGIEDDE